MSVVLYLIVALSGAAYKIIGWVVPFLPMGPTDPPTITLQGGTSNAKADRISLNAFATIRMPVIVIGAILMIIGAFTAGRGKKAGWAGVGGGAALIIFVSLPDQVMNTILAFASGLIQ